MKNYKDSDYALNRYSAGIVYKFADGTILTVTLKDYLAENPGKTAADFHALKELSDGDYFKRDRAGNAQTKRDKPLDELSAAMRYAPSPEELAIGEIDAREKALKRGRRIELSRRALNALTEIQRRRYMLYHIGGKTEEELAAIEGTTQQAISKSLLSAEKKIKKFLTKAKNRL